MPNNIMSEINKFIELKWNQLIKSIISRIITLESDIKIVISATEPTDPKYLTGKYIWVKIT